MLFAFVRGPVKNVNAATIALVSSDSSREVLVRVRQSAIVLFLELVAGKTRIWIAPLPELFDKFVPPLVGLQPFKLGSFRVADQVAHVFVEPHPVKRWKRLGCGFAILRRGKRW